MNRGIEVMSSATYLETSNWLFQENRGTKWTAEENKKFENALAYYDKDTPDRWFKVAAMLPGKTVGDVIKQYRELEEDVSDIEAGLIPVPGYASDSFTLDWGGYDEATGNNGFNMNGYYFATAGGKRGSAARTAEHERKKGVPWTEEEHRQFLMGLKKYGKGDWRNIARNFVTSRTPTQVASHAQKYFIRQVNGGKDKRRSSIHDITTVNIPDSPDAATADNATSNAPCSPPSVGGSQRETSEWEGQVLYDETATAFYNENAFQETLLGMSSTPYMAKLQEQSFLNATQFESYNLQM
ncbi:Transcription factor DIVARICATA [Cardamine amara subsp. amara]|uniref:Transcription factor DIVARICATA n=1 Tax=Cardamine amara subsp. amara TaxID=228776 RepID=A0ABD0ZSR4_CARAN